MADRVWIGEVRGRYVATVLVTAGSRKEAENKLRTGDDVEDFDVEHTSNSRGRIIKEYKVEN